MYDYCINNKLIDAALIAKWKKPGYEKLCSTYAINTQNSKYGSVSICRVPAKSLSAGQAVEDQTTGCRGCGSGATTRNIFGNKYGQYLAQIQVAREAREIGVVNGSERQAADDSDATGDEGGSDTESDSDSDSKTDGKHGGDRNEKNKNEWVVGSADGARMTATERKRRAIWAYDENEASAAATTAESFIGGGNSSSAASTAAANSSEKRHQYAPPGKRSRTK